MMKYSILSLFLALLLMSACSSSAPEVGSGAPTLATFAVDPHHTKVFFYAAYDRADDRPYFDETFILHTDNGDFVDITADQFFDMEIPPGNYLFTVDQISWAGNNLNHSSTKLRIDAGKPIFMKETVMPDGKATLTSVDVAQGEKDVMARTRKCVCGSELGRFINDL